MTGDQPNTEASRTTDPETLPEGLRDPIKVMEKVRAMQTDNPSAPDYDWQADREWFNQRLASERIRNASLHNRLVAMRAVLKGMKSSAAKYALAADDQARLTDARS